MPKATDCLVVVAGVNVGDNALESAMPGPWWAGGVVEEGQDVGS